MTPGEKNRNISLVYFQYGKKNKEARKGEGFLHSLHWLVLCPARALGSLSVQNVLKIPLGTSQSQESAREQLPARVRPQKYKPKAKSFSFSLIPESSSEIFRVRERANCKML